MVTTELLKTETPKLVVNNLNFFYGEYKALKDINLIIPKIKSRLSSAHRVVVSQPFCAH